MYDLLIIFAIGVAIACLGSVAIAIFYIALVIVIAVLSGILE